MWVFLFGKRYCYNYLRYSFISILFKLSYIVDINVESFGYKIIYI